MEVVMRYELKHLSLDQLNAEIDKIWKELNTDPGLREEATEAGIDLDALSRVNPSEAITIKREAAGFDYTPIIVAFAPVVATIAKDLWTSIILPRIKKRKGMDVVTPAPADKQ
jgi:hypothetical protein